MKKLLLLLVAVLTLSLGLKATEVKEYDFTPNTNTDGWPTTAPSEETTYTSKTHPELTLTFFEAKWAKNTSNSNIATTKNKSGYVKISPFEGKVVTKVQLYLPTGVTTKSKFDLFIDGNETAIGQFTTSNNGAYFNEIEIPANLQSKDNVLVIKTANTANQCGFGKIKFTFENADVDPAKVVTSVVIDPESREFEGEQEVTLTAYNADNTAIEGAEILYTLNEGEQQTGTSPVTFPLTETTTVKAWAKNVEPVEATFTKIIPPVKPEVPVLKIDGAVVDNDVEVYYGTEATIFAENATSISVNDVVTEGDSYTLTVEETSTVNAHGINGELVGEAAEFNFILKDPEITVSAGETTFADNGEYTLTKGDIVTISAVGAKTITVLNDGVAVTLADNTFAIENGGLYTFTASNGESTPVSVNVNITVVKPNYATRIATFDFTDANGAYGMEIHSTDHGNGTYEENVTSVKEVDATLTFNKNSGNGYRIWSTTNGNELRVQKGTTLTLSLPEDCEIQSVVFTGNDNKYINTINVSTAESNLVDRVNSTTEKVTTFTKMDSKFNTLTFTGNEEHMRISSIIVNYIENNPAPSKPQIQHSAEEGKIYVLVEEGCTAEYKHEVVTKQKVAALAEENETWYPVENGEILLSKHPIEDNQVSHFTIRAKNSVGKVSDVTVVSVESNGQLSGITDIEADVNAPVEYYNLQGVRVAEPVNGLYLRRSGNRVEKVVVR